MAAEAEQWGAKEAAALEEPARWGSAPQVRGKPVIGLAGEGTSWSSFNRAFLRTSGLEVDSVPTPAPAAHAANQGNQYLGDLGLPKRVLSAAAMRTRQGGLTMREFDANPYLQGTDLEGSPLSQATAEMPPPPQQEEEATIGEAALKPVAAITPALDAAWSAFSHIKGSASAPAPPPGDNALLTFRWGVTRPLAVPAAPQQAASKLERDAMSEQRAWSLSDMDGSASPSTDNLAAYIHRGRDRSSTQWTQAYSMVQEIHKAAKAQRPHYAELEG